MCVRKRAGGQPSLAAAEAHLGTCSGPRGRVATANGHEMTEWGTKMSDTRVIGYCISRGGSFLATRVQCTLCITTIYCYIRVTVRVLLSKVLRFAFFPVFTRVSKRSFSANVNSNLITSVRYGRVEQFRAISLRSARTVFENRS